MTSKFTDCPNCGPTGSWNYDGQQCVACGYGLSPSDDLLRFFAYGHLSEPLQAISRPFADLAIGMVKRLPDNGERHMALRKLLEAKDCAVRARL